MKKNRIKVYLSDSKEFTEDGYVYWPFDKLAYFILLVGKGKTPEEKYASLKMNPFNSFHIFRYKWSWDDFPIELFFKTIENIPSNSPDISFNPQLCKWITFEFDEQKTGGTVPLNLNKQLAEILFQVFEDKLSYIEFSYYHEADIYEAKIDTKILEELREHGRQIRRYFKNSHPALKEQLDNGELLGRTIVFGCRRENFDKEWSY